MPSWTLPDFVEGHYDTGFITKNGEYLQQRIMRTSEHSENIALIAAYMDYLMNLEENNSGMATDNRPISKWKEFGLHKGSVENLILTKRIQLWKFI